VLRMQTPAAQRCHTNTKIALARSFVDCGLQARSFNCVQTIHSID